MNKKTFGVAVVFFCAASVWFAVNIYWTFRGMNRIVDLVIALFFFMAGIGMVWNESQKKKRKHLADVDKNQIP